MLDRDTTWMREDAHRRLTGTPLAEETSFLLARANARSLAYGNAALAPLGLKVRSYAVLALAAEEHRPSQRDLATFLRLDPSQVVALVDDLEARGLVERTADPSDRRANAVVATPEGVRMVAVARDALTDAEALVFAGLDAEERASLAATLRRVAFWD
jgi:DNA-binding MarR family transcriptional regulator